MYIQIQVSVPSIDIAENLSALLLNNRLAACVQTLGPITSQYIWKEKLQREVEYLLLIKSTKALFSEITQAILAHHPYEVPEIIFSTIDGTEDYLQWIASCCRVS